VGLHSGRDVSVVVQPADSGHGIVFELDGGHIAAGLDAVCESVRCTSLRNGRVRVDTVEHLMAGLWAGGVDNAVVQVVGGEVPGLDGSALAVINTVGEAGLRELSGAARRVIAPRRPVYVEHDDARGVALPCDRLRLTVAVRFPEPVGEQIVDFEDARAAFADHIAPARTPGFIEEWDKLRALGLALGASADNVLPIFPDRYGATERVPSEVATHKALDLIGDLALLGGDLQAHVITCRGGHALNHALGRAILRATGE
jgi:UDP-3-O-acyl N-acetylglucosamine deacetylase